MREGKNIDDCDDNEKCSIIAASFVGPVAEWVEDERGPRCTAFEEWRGQDRRESWQRTLDEISGVRA